MVTVNFSPKRSSDKSIGEKQPPSGVLIQYQHYLYNILMLILPFQEWGGTD